MVTKAPRLGVDDMLKGKTTVRKRGQITIPKNILDALNLNEGDTLEFQFDDNGELKLVPMIQVPLDQAWFWTERWQAEEREAEEEIRLGHVRSFGDVHDLIAELESDD